MLRSNTLSVPAHVPNDTPAHRVFEEAVTLPGFERDPAALLAAAAANPSVSDAALRVYVVATVHDRGVTAAQVAATLPRYTESQAARLLGQLVTAGLLSKRLRTVGYKSSGLRIRRGFYTLAGGAL
jgi:hypothetical protein